MAKESSADLDLKGHETGLLDLLDSLKHLERKFNLENRFNLFEAINMARQEVRHSRFLAFLLDPSNPHGLADRFLRAILSAAIGEHPTPHISRLDAAIADLSGSSVHCERDHFDVTVEIPSLRLLFVIENKVDASEHKGQLAKYRVRAEARYRNTRFLGCFLTPDGYEGEDDQWGAMSYATVATELKQVIEDASPSSEVQIAVQHYIQLIERRIVASQALIDACRSIYAQHRSALDLIFEHGHVSGLDQAYEMFATEVQPVALRKTASRSTTLFFAYESWLKINSHPQADRKRWTSTFPVLLWFEVLNKKMNLRVEVGPFFDPTLDRANFLKRFPENWIDRKVKSGGKGVFTRIKRASVPIPEDATSEDLCEAMKKLWADTKPWNVENIVRTVIENMQVDAATSPPSATEASPPRE